MADAEKLSQSGRCITVVLGDDVAELRELLRWEVEQDGDMSVVGEGSNGREVLDVIGEQRPDVLLLDLSMPEMDGLEVLAELKKQCLDLRVIVLSGYTQQAMGERARAEGAHGYVEKGASGAVIREVVRRVMAPAVR